MDIFLLGMQNPTILRRQLLFLKLYMQLYARPTYCTLGLGKQLEQQDQRWPVKDNMNLLQNIILYSALHGKCKSSDYP